MNQRGSSRRTSLTRDRSSAVFHALQQTELQSESYEVSGELRGVMLEGRSTFQIRTDEGTVISGLVSRKAAPKVIGFSIGQRVTAKVERRIRRRVASSYETTTHRLMGLHVEAPSSGAANILIPGLSTRRPIAKNGGEFKGMRRNDGYKDWISQASAIGVH